MLTLFLMNFPFLALFAAFLGFMINIVYDSKVEQDNDNGDSEEC